MPSNHLKPEVIFKAIKIDKKMCLNIWQTLVAHY